MRPLYFFIVCLFMRMVGRLLVVAVRVAVVRVDIRADYVPDRLPLGWV